MPPIIPLSDQTIALLYSTVFSSLCKCSISIRTIRGWWAKSRKTHWSQIIIVICKAQVYPEGIRLQKEPIEAAQCASGGCCISESDPSLICRDCGWKGEYKDHSNGLTQGYKIWAWLMHKSSPQNFLLNRSNSISAPWSTFPLWESLIPALGSREFFMGWCSLLAICVNQILFTKTSGLEQTSMNPFLSPFHFGFTP
jgi:hypothetical protein